jgi:hypothetical protein
MNKEIKNEATADVKNETPVTAPAKKRGRPIVPTSRRQEKINLRLEMKANGIEVKLGRPPMKKVESSEFTPVEEAPVAETPKAPAKKAAKK